MWNTASENYGLVQTSAPAKEPVTVAEVRDFGLIPDNIQNALIQRLIASARERCETFTRRQFITATWALTLDCFPSWEIKLRRGPWTATSISTGGSVAYLDTAGDSQTVATADYRFDHVQGRLTPVHGSIWPSTYDVTNAVTITYTSGYGTAPSAVPEGIKTAIIMTVLDWVENRRGVFDLPIGVQQMLLSFWTGESL